MEAKHTSGEWVYNKNSLLVECNGDNVVMPSNFHSYPKPTHETFKNDKLFIEAEANAKLISAAPELLEALMEIKRLYGDRTDYIGEYKIAWENVNNAINKATK